MTALAVLAIGGAALFARADQATRIAEDARSLGDLQAALADAATHRAALVVAFASIGDTVPAVAFEAVDEALLAVDRIRGRLGTDSELASQAETVTRFTQELRSLLVVGETNEARAAVERDVLPAISVLATGLSQEVANVSGRIELEQARAGTLARAASFVVALIVPILAVVGLRVAARRRLERERLEAEVKRQRDLAEARDRLIAGLSHQLRTPITGIYVWSDLLDQDQQLAAEGARAILSQAGDLKRMVDNILVAARIDSSALANRPEPTEPSRIVAAALAHFRRVGSTFLVDCEAALVLVDGPRLEQAIHNLAANAVIHGDPPVEVVGRASDSWYRIAVIDRGPGLDEERSRDPFAPYARASEELTTSPSLGLGLSVAEALARLMGGRLEYLRRDGCTIFALRVPLVAKVSEPSPQLVP